MEEKSLDLEFDFKGKKHVITLDEEKILVKCHFVKENKDENKVIAGDYDFVYEMDCTETGVTK